MKKGFIVNGLSAGAMFVCIITQRACTDSDLKGKLTGQILQVPPAIHPGPDGYSERYVQAQILCEGGELIARISYQV